VSADTPERDEIVGLEFEVDLTLTLGELGKGPRDPTIRFERGVVWRAVRTTAGPATTRLAPAAGGVRVSAWGPGADTAVAAVSRLLGVEDDPAALHLPAGRLRGLAARFRGLRFGRTDSVWPALLPAICGQKVTAAEAHRAYFGIVRRWGQEAPGPVGLRMAPEPATIAALRYFELHPLGLEQRRAITLIRAAERAAWLEAAVDLPREAALARLRQLPGVGPWTAAEVARRAFGDPDAVSVGDYHIPHLVCWALAGEPRGDDARMLELLEPFTGQRARVVRLLELAGTGYPRYGPPLAPRDIGRL
jgi:3-methyladenine DNA glycosylase/8-oxoguanine DNA glycosylase